MLEISHRSKAFDKILQSTKRRLTDLLSVPDTHEILFLQGGSRLQFSMIPMNLLRGAKGPADYILTGSWSKKAIEEAQREGEARVAWDGKAKNYDRLPPPDQIKLDASAAYVYFTSNETIEGVQFVTEPKVNDVPLVCDASSDFLCRPLPVDRYGILYACAKERGPGWSHHRHHPQRPCSARQG